MQMFLIGVLIGALAIWGILVIIGLRAKKRSVRPLKNECLSGTPAAAMEMLDATKPPDIEEDTIRRKHPISYL